MSLPIFENYFRSSRLFSCVSHKGSKVFLGHDACFVVNQLAACQCSKLLVQLARRALLEAQSRAVLSSAKCFPGLYPLHGIGGYETIMVWCKCSRSTVDRGENNSTCLMQFRTVTCDYK